MFTRSHYKLERHTIGFAVAIIVVSAIGGIFEIAPLFTIDETVETAPDMRLYTPLELAGRNIYNPRDVVPQSVMPAYRWLQRNTLRTEDLGRHLKAQRLVGVPYTDDMIAHAEQDAKAQANPDSDNAGGVSERYGEATHVRAFDGNPRDVTEMDALVAYLQILGRLTEAAYQNTDKGE